MRLAIKLGRGAAKLVSETSNKADLKEFNSYVVNSNASPNKELEDYLTSYGLRMVSESEIVLAVLLGSMKKYCNPNSGKEDSIPNEDLSQTQFTNQDNEPFEPYMALNMWGSKPSTNDEESKDETLAKKPEISQDNSFSNEKCFDKKNSTIPKQTLEDEEENVSIDDQTDQTLDVSNLETSTVNKRQLSSNNNSEPEKKMTKKLKHGAKDQKKVQDVKRALFIGSNTTDQNEEEWIRSVDSSLLPQQFVKKDLIVERDARSNVCSQNGVVNFKKFKKTAGVDSQLSSLQSTQSLSFKLHKVHP